MSFKDLHWIGIAKEEYERKGLRPGTQIVPAYFGLEANLETVPESLVIRITGRSQYKLFVNGKSVIFGPLRGRAYQAAVDEPDIASWLKAGKNRILVQAMSYPSKPEEAKYEGPVHCFADDGGPGIAVSGTVGDTDLGVSENWRGVLDDGTDFNDCQWILSGSTEAADLKKRAKLPFFAEEWRLDGVPCAVDLESNSSNFTGERMGRRFEARQIPPLYRRERCFADVWMTDEYGRMPEGTEKTVITREAPADEQTKDLKEDLTENLTEELKEDLTEDLTEDLKKNPKEDLTEKPVIRDGAAACGIGPYRKIHFVLDAGELTTAYPRYSFSGGAGAKLRFTYAECFLQGGKDEPSYKEIRDDRRGFIDGLHDDLLLSGKQESYEPFRFRTFRFIRVDVETADEGLELEILPFIETAYPLVNDKRPVFTDPKKEKLYDVALRTLQLCMHDTYEDCPYYEQLQYASDSRLEILFTYSSSTDTRLPEYAIDLFASSLLPEGLTQARFPCRKLQVITGFAFYFVMMLEDYINASGKPEKMAEYITVAEKIVESALACRHESGLIAARGYERGYWEFWDWTKEWDPKAGTPNAIMDCGVSTLENLVFIYTVQSLARILPYYHRNELASHYLAEAKQLSGRVQELCFDREKGLYREAPGYGEYSQHSQVFAVLTGLAEGEAAKALMEKVLSDESLVKCSFVQRFYLFRALEKAGMYDRTEALWEDWQHMIDLHCTTFPETPYYPRSECHAWSALPLYEFGQKERQAGCR